MPAPEAWSAQPPATVPPSRPLPGSLVAAAVLLLVGAALAGLVGALMLLGGAMVSQIPMDLGGYGLTEAEWRASMGFAGAFVLVFAGLALLVATAHLLSGIGVLRRRGWGRILGLVVSSLGCLFFGLGLVLALLSRIEPIPEGYLEDIGLTLAQYERMASMGQAFGVGITAVGLAAYVFVLIVLARRGGEFA